MALNLDDSFDYSGPKYLPRKQITDIVNGMALTSVKHQNIYKD